jgi:nucleoid-associated protein YgaU
MKPESRVGLVLAMVCIIGFGFILTELRGTGENVMPATAQAMVEPDYFRQTEPEQEQLAFAPLPARNEAPVHLAAAPEAPPAPARREQPSAEALVRPPVSSGPQHVEAAIRGPSEEPEPARLAPQPVHLETPLESFAAETPSVRPSEPPDRVATTRTYQVQASDTLYAVAVKAYGPGQGRLYRQIFEANRHQMSDPSEIRVGQVLVIPPFSPDAAAASTPGGGQPPVNASREVDTEQLRQFVRGNQARSAPRVYVVQSGDNLTRIARKVYNDGSKEAVDKLFEANRDRLRDRHSVRAGMELRVPNG